MLVQNCKFFRTVLEHQYLTIFCNAVRIFVDTYIHQNISCASQLFIYFPA